LKTIFFSGKSDIVAQRKHNTYFNMLVFNIINNNAVHPGVNYNCELEMNYFKKCIFCPNNAPTANVV
jgi:hypothetical protein